MLQDIVTNGKARQDRTGVGTVALFGRSLRYDLSKGFPLVTTKRCHFKSIKHELLWFLSGSSNIRPLQANGVTIWDEWADEDGELGPVYGSQWRAWRDQCGAQHDQVSQLLVQIKTKPQSRRHLVSAWNVGELAAMALVPCHVLYQVWVNEDQLSLQVYQRSADVFLGVPFNIASYALLAHLLAKATGLKVAELIMVFGDTHLYRNHFEQAKLQLSRAPKPLAELVLSGDTSDIFAVQAEQITLANYQFHPLIKAPIAV